MSEDVKTTTSEPRRLDVETETLPSSLRNTAEEWHPFLQMMIRKAKAAQVDKNRS